jgi:hypothetical protein
MHRALIFSGVFGLSTGMLVFLLRGKQVRKERDEEMQQRSRRMEASVVAIGTDNSEDKMSV